LDELAAKMIASGANVQDVLAQAETAVSAVTDEKETKNAKIYQKIFQAVAQNGATFVQNEAKRLDRMMEGSISPKKLDEFTVRRNILAAFQ
jgi:protein disulfide-isomerase A6